MLTTYLMSLCRGSAAFIPFFFIYEKNKIEAINYL